MIPDVPVALLAAAGQAPSWLGPPLLGLIGAGLVAWFGYRQATKVARTAAETEARRIDSGAYQRAKELYESGISQLEEQLDRLRAQLAEERLEKQQLREQVREMDLTLARMRRQLILAGIEDNPPT